LSIFKFHQVFNEKCYFRIKNSYKVDVLGDTEMTATKDHKNKLTFIAFRKVSNTIMSQQSKKGISIHFLDENTLTYHFSLMFAVPNSKNKIFIKKIDQIITAGLAQKVEVGQESVDREAKIDAKFEPQPLTMDHLGVCFIVIIVCLALCCVVFLAEVLMRRLTN
jgi:hypothetical protein